MTKRLTILIPLYGGIGNIIQTIPLILHFKKMGHKVVGVRAGIDFKESELLLDGIVDDIINGTQALNYPHDVPCKRLRYDARYIAEWQGWFQTYGLPVPTEEEIDIRTNFIIKSIFSMEVCVCPACKDNWPMKKYNQWNELIDALIDMGYVVGVVGQNKDIQNIKTKKIGVIPFVDRPLLEVAGILKRTRFTICNEGGLGHLSAAQGTETYILMGGSHPIKNKPPKNAHLISAGLPCQPCQLGSAYIDKDTDPPIFHGCKPNENNYVKCLDILKPEYILKEINKTTELGKIK